MYNIVSLSILCKKQSIKNIVIHFSTNFKKGGDFLFEFFWEQNLKELLSCLLSTSLKYFTSSKYLLLIAAIHGRLKHRIHNPLSSYASYSLLEEYPHRY